jgi:hypothetical protein
MRISAIRICIVDRLIRNALTPQKHHLKYGILDVKNLNVAAFITDIHKKNCGYPYANVNYGCQPFEF